MECRASVVLSMPSSSSKFAKMPWIVVTYLFVALLEGYCMEVASSARLPDIYWNASNPIFRIDNTDHIIDVNRGNNQFEYDQVNLICPTYPKGTRAEDTESYIIYNVSKEEYNSCSITNSRARIIAVCDKPHQLMYFTITFRSFTPQPGGLEFKPGQDYYFVSTSTGSPRGVHQKFGGRCATHNMRVTFKVCCGEGQTSPSLSQATTGNATSTRMDDAAGDKSNKSASSAGFLPVKPAPSSESLSPAEASAAASRPGSKPSIIITTIKPPSLILNSTASDPRDFGDGMPPLMPSAIAPMVPSTSRTSGTGSNDRDTSNYNKASSGSRRFGGKSGGGPHLTPLWSNSASGQEAPYSSSPKPMLAVTTASSAMSTSTPYWWRPHFTKMPSVKSSADVHHGGGGDPSWAPGSSSAGGSGSGGGGGGGGSKSRKTGKSRQSSAYPNESKNSLELVTNSCSHFLQQSVQHYLSVFCLFLLARLSLRFTST